jgi:hypothetical protein
MISRQAKRRPAKGLALKIGVLGPPFAQSRTVLNETTTTLGPCCPVRCCSSESIEIRLSSSDCPGLLLASFEPGLA